MSVLQRPLMEIAKFKVYTWDSYLAEFGVMPPYDPEAKVKRWADPGAMSVSGVSKNIVYTNTLAVSPFGQPVLDAKGRPSIDEPLVIPRTLAAEYNIPDRDWEQIKDRETEEIPVPLDPSKVSPEEEIVYDQRAGGVVIRNLKAWEEEKNSGTLEDEILGTVRSIEKQIGVIDARLKRMEDRSLVR